MPFSLSLRTKIALIFTTMAAIVLSGGVSMLWYTYQVDTMHRTMVNKEFVLYKTAQDMELALANQRGFLTYYFVDGEGKWLESLGEYRQVFKQSLEQVSSLPLNSRQKETLDLINVQYSSYIDAKDVAIENYKAATSRESISSFHEKQRDVFFNLLGLCRAFSQDQWQVIHQAEENNYRRSETMRAMGYGAVLIFLSLCSLLLFILYKQILGPIRGLAIETGSSPQDSSRDEVVSLSHSLKDMMRDFDETHDELEKSRKHLLQMERMAVVGELAAGVAHTIRNPFTSIKMRMFSLARSLDLDDVQNEDLTVISDEIGRIDKIVQNFLEFARPPKIRFEECRLGTLINSVITLMEYRLRKYRVEIAYDFQPDLPRVSLDSDRIKEALVNLFTNSCEAMETGGRIEIFETREDDPDLGEVAVITLRDSGPGIPEEIIHKVTAPFFTTKEDGSGLGLSIVARIILEHKGKLTISSSTDQCTEFKIILPVKRDDHESDINH